RKARPAVAKPPPLAAEGRQGHQEHVGVKGGLVGLGLGNAPHTALQRLARMERAKHERLRPALNDGKGQRELAAKSPHERPDREFLRQRRECGYHASCGQRRQERKAELGDRPRRRFFHLRVERATPRPHARAQRPLVRKDVGWIAHSQAMGPTRLLTISPKAWLT